MKVCLTKGVDEWVLRLFGMPGCRFEAIATSLSIEEPVTSKCTSLLAAEALLRSSLDLLPAFIPTGVVRDVDAHAFMLASLYNMSDIGLMLASL